ncbi:MAG: response regulator [Candidatus Omnitrophica bacterium]|nr:response regulator [Candidatus Omnitrophota bacterium]
MKAKILLVDDDKDVLKSLENLLRRSEYDVTSVGDSLEAIELTKEHDFDLVITDIRMPNINGIEVIKRIIVLQDRLGKEKSEFMVITGYADDDAPKEGALLGITNFVIKPFDSNVFLESIKSCLDGKKGKLPEIVESKPQKPAIPLPNKHFSIEKTVFLRDTNIMGNTYFANYIMWQGEAREACLMTHPNFAEEMQKNQHIKMITHSLYHRFVQETTFGDRVEIRVSTREIKHCSFVLVFRYYNKLTEAFLGEGWQRLTFADIRTGSLTAIPTFIHELAMAAKEDNEKQYK